MIKISVIVPVYNAEKHLRKCLDSLYNQTLKELEVLIINDGSTDNSQKIIDEYCKKDPQKFISIKQKNGGPGKARNLGIQKAQGKYVGFVDSDDWVDVRMFELMFEKIEEEKVEILICDYYNVVDRKKEVVLNGFKDYFPTSLKQKPFILNKLKFAPWGKLYKKSLFKSLLFPENLKYEDLELIPKIFFEAKNISKINLPLYYYMINNQGETATVNPKIFDIFEVLSSLETYFKQKTKSKKFTIELEYMLIDKIMSYNQRALFLKDKKLRKKFVSTSYAFLNKKVKNWKKNQYFIVSPYNFRKKIHNCIIKNEKIFIFYSIYLKKYLRKKNYE